MNKHATQQGGLWKRLTNCLLLGRSVSGRSIFCRSVSGRSIFCRSVSGRSVSGRSVLVWLAFGWLVFSSGLPANAQEIRIMSYNIRNAKGLDDITDYERISRVIVEAAPTVVAVQELDSMTVRSQGTYVLETLGRQTLMHATYGPAIDFQGGKYGIGILSKEKPLHVCCVPLPGREEARALLMAEFSTYVLCCTHFSLTPEDQLLSIPVIEEALETQTQLWKAQTKPVFLAGDMNSTPDSEVQQRLANSFHVLSNPKNATFPANEPTLCIDYIYQWNGGNGGDGGNIANGPTATTLSRNVLTTAGTASDHLPIVVDVRIPMAKEQVFRTQPFLQNPTHRGMTVTWLTNVPVHSWVEYGTERGHLDHKQQTLVDGQVVCNNKIHKIRLTDLAPGTTYYYRACSREMLLYEGYKKAFGPTVYSPEYAFTTPSEGQQDFTAVIFNDLHKKTATLAHLASYLENIDYQLVFFNGDCIDNPRTEAEAVDFLVQMTQTVHAQQVPIIIIRGNHEIRDAYSLGLRDILDYPDDKTYSAFNWGDTRFVLLDCGEDKPDSTAVYYQLNDFTQLRSQQAQFLHQEVHSRAFKKASRRVLIHHIPIYGYPADAFNPCLDAWGSVLAQAPFDLSINAHEHVYAFYPAGTKANPFPVVIGGGSSPTNATVFVLKKTGDTLTLEVNGANYNHYIHHIPHGGRSGSSF